MSKRIFFWFGCLQIYRLDYLFFDFFVAVAFAIRLNDVRDSFTVLALLLRPRIYFSYEDLPWCLILYLKVSR
jgi:hypothetical protein